MTIWCPGIPGAGKTVLASVATKRLQDAQRLKQSALRAGIVCLYCEYERQEDQTAQQLFSAALRQLSEQSSQILESVTQLYQFSTAEKRKPSFDKIVSMFYDAIRSFPEVFIILDALDECSEETCRELLGTLSTLQNATGLKLLVTSRRTVEFWKFFPECGELEVRAAEGDVKVVLDVQVERLSACVRNDGELRKTVIERVATAVDGMYAAHISLLTIPF